MLVGEDRYILLVVFNNHESKVIIIIFVRFHFASLITQYLMNFHLIPSIIREAHPLSTSVKGEALSCEMDLTPV